MHVKFRCGNAAVVPIEVRVSETLHENYACSSFASDQRHTPMQHVEDETRLLSP